MGRAFVDAKADVAGAGEGNEAGEGMVDEEVADFAAGGGKEIEDALGHARFLQGFDGLIADHRRQRRRLEDDGIARDQGGGPPCP